MDRLKKITNMFSAALDQAARESGMLLGQELSLSGIETQQVTRDEYASLIEEACYVAEVQSVEDYPGSLYLLFSLRDAIVMSGSLLGIPPGRIAEKSKLAIMEGDDVDAFSEILNQIIGSFKSALQPGLPKKFFLKLLPPRQVVPKEGEPLADDLLPAGDYISLRTRLTMKDRELDRFDLLITLDLAAMLDPDLFKPEPPPAVEEPEAVPSADDTSNNSLAPATAEGDAPQVILLDDDGEERQKVQELLTAAGFRVVAAPVEEDFRNLPELQTVRVVVIGLHSVDDRELALSIKLKAASENRSVPIIMCAKEWTRTAVLKALKFGARDILLKPVAAQELVAKVEKFLNAA